MISNRKKDILNATRKIFTKKGYYGTTMNAIAEEVGIRKASLYAHFNHKDAIFFHLFEEIIEEHSKALEIIFKLMEGASVKNQLYIFLTHYINYCYNNETITLWNHFYYYPPESMEKMIRNGTHRNEHIIKDKILAIIKEGQEKGYIRDYNLASLYQLYYNLYIGFVLSAPEYENKDIKKEIRDCFVLFWDAVKKV